MKIMFLLVRSHGICTRRRTRVERHPTNLVQGCPAPATSDTVACFTNPEARPMPPVEPAGFRVRTIAALIDTALFLLLTVPLMWLVYGEKVARFDDVRPWSLAINWLLPSVLAISFWSTIGSTPGKILMSLMVVDTDTGRAPALWRCVVRWLAYAVSAAPLGLGFLWVLLDPDRRAWHDRLARTRVVQPRRNLRGSRAYKGYFAAHWAGDLPLALSFWVNNILLAFPLGLALGGLMTWISLKGELLQTSSIATLIAFPLMVLLNVWCIVGAWRSATHHGDNGGATIFSLAVKFLMLLSTIQLATATVMDFLPRVGEYVQMARGIDPIGQAEIVLSADGQTLRLKGPIGMGDGSRVRLATAGAGKLQVIELESPGGRVFEADQMAALIRSHGWQTRAIGGCESACTLVFMAGSTRQLMPGAQLGFHRAFAGTFNPVIDHVANQELAAMYRRAGLPEDFIARTLRTPPWQMWYPDIDALAQAALITPPQWSLLVPLPARAVQTPVSIAEALRTSQVWHALELRYPGSIGIAARRMQAAHARRAPDAAVMDEGQQVARGLLRRLLREGSHDAREQYLGLLAEQLRATRAGGRHSCRALLNGDGGARRALPPALVQMESDWIIQAADEPVGRTRAPQATPLEREVIRRMLGDSAPAQLAQLWSLAGMGGPGPDCTGAITLLENIGRLQSGQRQLAAQWMFQQP